MFPVLILYVLNPCRAKYSLKRRLRIKTVRFPTAANISEIYDSVDAEVVLSILVHEVTLANLRIVINYCHSGIVQQKEVRSLSHNEAKHQ